MHYNPSFEIKNQKTKLFTDAIKRIQALEQETSTLEQIVELVKANSPL